jgi:type II secretion system protein G
MIEMTGNRTAERTRASGFTLVELLIVVAIIGIISAIALPNLMNAIDKAKQKRTMGDMRGICTAIEAYATDNANYPANQSAWSTIKVHLNPHFIREPPDEDGWSNGWDVATSTNGSDYSLSSFGKDGVLSSRSGGATTDFDCDIVYSNGGFFQWPEGTQS